jgi:hypothetical protein
MMGWMVRGESGTTVVPKEDNIPRIPPYISSNEGPRISSQELGNNYMAEIHESKDVKRFLW